MSKLKPLDVKAYYKSQDRIRELIGIAEESREPVKAFNALMVNHINNDVPSNLAFRRQAIIGEFPRPFKAWTAIERLMLHHGLYIRFDKHKDTTWIHRNHHPLHPKNGFPFRRDLNLSMKMINWINCHPCIIQPVNQIKLIELMQDKDSPFVEG